MLGLGFGLGITGASSRAGTLGGWFLAFGLWNDRGVWKDGEAL